MCTNLCAIPDISCPFFPHKQKDNVRYQLGCYFKLLDCLGIYCIICGTVLVPIVIWIQFVRNVVVDVSFFTCAPVGVSPVFFQKAKMSEEKNLSSLHDQLQQEAAKLVRWTNSLPPEIIGIDRPFGGGVESILIRSLVVNWRLRYFFYLILKGLLHKISKKP